MSQAEALKEWLEQEAALEQEASQAVAKRPAAEMEQGATPSVKKRPAAVMLKKPSASKAKSLARTLAAENDSTEVPDDVPRDRNKHRFFMNGVQTGEIPSELQGLLEEAQKGTNPRKSVTKLVNASVVAQPSGKMTFRVDHPYIQEQKTKYENKYSRDEQRGLLE